MLRMTDNFFVEISAVDVGHTPELHPNTTKVLLYQARRARFLDTIQHGFEKVFSFVREIHRIMTI
jgi:hypothetical protein